MPGERVGTRFGPYRLDALLGAGGMGEVYRAYDTAKDRVVALKLLNPALARDPVYRERFRRESQTAARLGEPHIIPIHDWGEVDGVLFIDMRLVQGGDLRGLLRHARRLPPPRAVALLEQIAAALDAAHAQRLIHRDVKPENILVTDRDFAYLVDFGIADSAGDTRLTEVGGAIGSVAYMAPELFDGHPAGPASDVYALACVLCECLTGQVPFPAATVGAAIKAAVTTPPPLVSTLVPELSPAWDPVIVRGLSPDPRRRFGSAGELMTAAAQAARATGAPYGTVPTPFAPTPLAPTPLAPTALVPAPPTKKFWGLPVLIGIVALVLALAVGALIAVTAFDADGSGEGAQAPLTASTAVSETPGRTSASLAPSSSPPTSSPSSNTVRTYPAPTPDVVVSADPSAPGYVPPPPPIDEAQYFAQFGAFNYLDTARQTASEHYGSVIVDGSLVGLRTRYAVVRPTRSWAEAERVCAKFGAGQCYPQRRVG